MILELAHELEHLKRVEAEVGQQFALWCGINRTPAQSLQDLYRLAFEPIGGPCGCALRGSSAPRVCYVGQALECNMNVTLGARRAA